MFSIKIKIDTDTIGFQLVENNEEITDRDIVLSLYNGIKEDINRRLNTAKAEQDVRNYLNGIGKAN